MKSLLKSFGLGILLLIAYKTGGMVFMPSPLKTKTNRAAPDISPTALRADLVINGLHLTETAGNQLLWEIEADTAQVYQQQQATQLNNINLIVYEEQQPVLKVQGQKGRLNMQSRDVAITGQVIANSQAGLTFETNSLNWENQKRLLYTSDPVKITRDNIQIQGLGLVADVSLEKLEFHNGVTTIIN